MNHVKESLILSGQFGEITVDTKRPCVHRLNLRQNDGELSVKSLLSSWPSESLPYTTGAYSYVEDLAGVRYESTGSRRHVVERADDREIVIRGIDLLPDKLDIEPIVKEDWRLRVDDNGDLRWEIIQNWQRDCELHKSATPGLFFNIRANAVPTGSGQRRLNPEQNGVATFMWIKPEMLEKNFYSYFELISPFFWACEVNNHVLYTRRNGWVRVKLYTSFPNNRDLYLRVENGYLFRRAKYNSHSEIGLLNDLKNERYKGVAEAETSMYKACKITFNKGEKAVFALVIGSRKADETGLQLKAEIPDKEIESALSDFYGGLANAGMWASQCSYETGNQPDGWKLGAFWMPAVALSVGVSAEEPLSTDHYPVTEAFREELQKLFGLVNDEGFIEYGGFIENRYHKGHALPGVNLQFMLKLDMYLRATGDIELVRDHFDKIVKIVEFFERYVLDGLLTFSRKDRLLIYFDAWHPDGVIAYLNIFYARALEAYSLCLKIAGKSEESVSVDNKRRTVIRTINETLWDDNAFGPGQGGYVDMIDTTGKKHCYFASCTEYPAIVFGVASPQQGTAILRTADERLAELTREYDVKGDATLDTLWPLEKEVECRQYPFTTYQSGSVLACWTYFEVVARSQCGDVDTACERLRRFAAHAGRTNWFEGDSAHNIRSEPHGWGQEPFLSDQVAVAAALIHGILGIKQTLEGVKVSGALPSGWEKARAVVPCFGKRVEVVREKGKTSIRKIGDL